MNPLTEKSDLKTDAVYGIGVDIGGTKIMIIISDATGAIHYQEKVKTTNDPEQIAALIKASMRKAEILEENVVAMGIGVPGPADSASGVVIIAPALDWYQFPLKERIQPHFSFPVFVNNDVNCALLGERWLGTGSPSDNIFFIAIGTGMGSAIVADGHLIYGHRFEAGEIGLQVTAEDVQRHRLNPLDKLEVYENKISGTALSASGYPSEALFTMHAEGNIEVAPIIEYFMLHLSVGIANAVNLLNPEKVILGGGVSESLEALLPELQLAVNRLTPIKVKLELATLRNGAGALGAIAYALQETKIRKGAKL